MPDYREDEEFIEMDFERKMEWFKEEFKTSFGEPNQFTQYAEEDRDLYRRLLNKMSETMNQYTHEPLLYQLVATLNEIKNLYDYYMVE